MLNQDCAYKKTIYNGIYKCFEKVYKLTDKRQRIYGLCTINLSKWCDFKVCVFKLEKWKHHIEWMKTFCEFVGR